jgi:hypothetical protein
MLVEEVLAASRVLRVHLVVTRDARFTRVECEGCHVLLYVAEGAFPSLPIADLIAHVILAHDWAGH